MSYVSFNRLPHFSQDIVRFVNGQPVRIPTIDNIGINRFSAIGRSDQDGMINCNPSRIPTHHDPRLMTLDQMVEYQKHPAPIGDNAQFYGL